MRKVVGIHSCLEALRVRPKSVKAVYVKKSKKPQVNQIQSIIEMAQKYRIKIIEKDMSFFENVAQTHQGICIEVSDGPQFSWESLENKEKCTLVFLDELEDPHNLGAILRTCWLFGVVAVFVTSRRSASLTPAAAKVASGAAEHVPIVELNNFTAALQDLKNMGFWVYGMSEKAKETVAQTQFSEKSVLIVGAEGKGLRKSTLGFCDQLVALPQVEKSASLNASVAASLVIYEATKSHFS